MIKHKLSCIWSGVAYKGELVAGVIMDPFRDECFTATLGGGAFLNGDRIQVKQGATSLNFIIMVCPLG